MEEKVVMVDNGHFLEFLEREFEPWFASRPHGLEALSEFSDVAYAASSRYLKNHIIPAVTVEHKLSVAVSLLEHVSARSGNRRIPASMVSWEKADRLCMAYPQLNDKIIAALSDCSCPSSNCTSNVLVIY